MQQKNTWKKLVLNLLSGEVLGQRPMSQHGPALGTIEKESDRMEKLSDHYLPYYRNNS